MALRRSNSQELRKIKNEEQLVNSSKVQRNNSLFIKKRKASNLLDKETAESLKHVFEPKLVKLCFKGPGTAEESNLTHRVNKDILLDNYLSRLRVSNSASKKQ